MKTHVRGSPPINEQLNSLNPTLLFLNPAFQEPVLLAADYVRSETQ